MNRDTQVQKKIILQKAFELVGSHGWSDKMLEQACYEASLDKNYMSLIFINGINDLIDMYFSHIDDLMIQALNTLDTNNLGISDKIKLALKTRIKILEINRPTVTRTISYLSLPWNISLGLTLGWRSMDRIWGDFVGDSSSDFNYYTKRGLLFAAYMASVQFMLSDYSIDLSETNDFIDRRINNILSLGKFISSFKNKY